MEKRRRLFSASEIREQQEILAVLNGYITALDDYPQDIKQSYDFALNPFDYLFKILQLFGVTTDEIIEWLAKYIKYAIPVIELGVKGILLSNLKNLITCSVDPRIPAYAREKGMTFDIGQFDVLNLLSKSPLISGENMMYFGTDGCTSPYNFLRPLDFNTFLWYVIHRGKYPSPTTVTIQSQSKDADAAAYKNFFLEKFGGNVTEGVYNGRADNIYDITELAYSEDNITPGILVGNSFKQEIVTNGRRAYLDGISVCTTAKYINTEPKWVYQQTDKSFAKQTPKIISNVLMPVGSEWDRTNYYVNRKTYFNFIDPTGGLDRNNPRDYNKDIGLCSFKFIDKLNNADTEYNDFYNQSNKLNIKILPKPFIHIPHIGQTTLLPKYALFNNHGEVDSDGKFSVIVSGKCHTNITTLLMNLVREKFPDKDPQKAYDDVYYQLLDSNDTSTNDYYEIENALWWYDLKYTDKVYVQAAPYKLVFDRKGNYKIAEYNPSFETGGISFDDIPEIENPSLILPLLQECYVNLTIFEFNYDYIMGMRLYDAKVVTTQLVNELIRMRLGLSLTLSQSEIEGQERIVRIVEKMVEANDYESSDCFYSFSNEEYEQMSMDAEEKRSQRIPFGDCSDVLTDNNKAQIMDAINNFGDAKELNETIDSFSRVVREVSATIDQEGTDAEVDLTYSFEIINNFIKNLTIVLVNSILSPKVILIVLINKRLCGQDDIRNWSLSQLLSGMEGIILKIVKEIRDLLLKELIKFALIRINALLHMLFSNLVLEQIEVYRQAIKLLIKACTFGRGRRYDIDTKLDQVDYADIDEVQPQPPSEKC